MALEIIQHTPKWVFVLLAGLLLLGYSQSKNRKMSCKRIFVLPIAMLLLSAFGVFSAFHTQFFAWLCWFLGLIFSLFIGVKYFNLKNAVWKDGENLFYIQGSWTPMILILIIFFIKYFVGMVIARELSIMNTLEFLVVVSTSYGILSGIFLSRALLMIQLKNN